MLLRLDKESLDYRLNKESAIVRVSEVSTHDTGLVASVEHIDKLSKAEFEGRAREELPSIMPPSFVGLHEPTSLQHISELYGFFKQTKWCACVGCWRAWYSTPRGYAFDQVTTKVGARRLWFQPEQNTFFPEHDRPSAFGQTLCYFSSIHLNTRLDVTF